MRGVKYDDEIAATMRDVVADVQRDIVALWGGPGFHIVHYPLRHGELFNIVAVFRRSADSEQGDVAAYRAESNAGDWVTRSIRRRGGPTFR